MPRSKKWIYICGICRLPILSDLHDRHSDGNGWRHLSCEAGSAPTYENWLRKEVGAAEGRGWEHE
jgi:hypothetical protein